MDKIRIPGELGFMILTEDGRIADSGGQLKNDDRLANFVHQIKNALDVSYHALNDNVHSMTIQYDDHIYVLVFEPRRSLIIKRQIANLNSSILSGTSTTGNSTFNITATSSS